MANETAVAETSGVAEQHYPFRFTGSGGEYFRIWIVNVLLTIITFYIYSAWAKVRTKRYFHGNTVLDDSPFEYHATGLQILIGRIIAVALFLVVTFGSIVSPIVSSIVAVLFVLVLPWAVWRSTKFNARMTSYRNVRFGFSGSLGKMYLYLLVLPLLPLVVGAGVLALILTAGGPASVAAAALGMGILVFIAMTPWVQRQFSSYFVNHYRYGTARFTGVLSTGRFYAIYLISFLLAMASLLVFAALALVVAWQSGMELSDLTVLMDADVAPDVPDEASFWIIALTSGAYLFSLLVGFFIMAYHRSRMRNHVFGGTTIDQTVRLSSTMRARSLAWLNISNVLLLVLTLGLAAPWTKVRSARYIARHTAALSATGLHAVVDEQHARQSTLGEEIGDAFDMDVDIGF